MATVCRRQSSTSVCFRVVVGEWANRGWCGRVHAKPGNERTHVAAISVADVHLMIHIDTVKSAHPTSTLNADVSLHLHWKRWTVRFSPEFSRILMVLPFCRSRLFGWERWALFSTIARTHVYPWLHIHTFDKSIYHLVPRIIAFG